MHVQTVGELTSGLYGSYDLPSSGLKEGMFSIPSKDVSEFSSILLKDKINISFSLSDFSLTSISNEELRPIFPTSSSPKKVEAVVDKMCEICLRSKAVKNYPSKNPRFIKNKEVRLCNPCHRLAKTAERVDIICQECNKGRVAKVVHPVTLASRVCLLCYHRLVLPKRKKERIEKGLICGYCTLRTIGRKKKSQNLSTRVNPLNRKEKICRSCYDFVKSRHFSDPCTNCSKGKPAIRPHPITKATKVCGTCYCKLLRERKLLRNMIT